MCWLVAAVVVALWVIPWLVSKMEFEVDTNTHYLLQEATRWSTGSVVFRFVVFTGNKHKGIVRERKAWLKSLGADWEISKEQITTRQHWQTRLMMNRIEEERWDALLK